jgi:hypothetical protein
MTNDSIIECAQALAARSGGDWADYLIAARREAHAPLQKFHKKFDRRDEALRKKGAVAQLRHMPGVGDPNPDPRIEAGEIATESFGRLRVAISKDSLAIYNINVLLADLSADLRTAVIASGAAFAAAENDVEQTKQRVIIGILMNAILRRDKSLAASVRAAKLRERFDN